jgi:hypothetical protein
MRSTMWVRQILKADNGTDKEKDYVCHMRILHTRKWELMNCLGRKWMGFLSTIEGLLTIHDST